MYQNKKGKLRKTIRNELYKILGQGKKENKSKPLTKKQICGLANEIDINGSLEDLIKKKIIDCAKKILYKIFKLYDKIEFSADNMQFVAKSTIQLLDFIRKDFDLPVFFNFNRFDEEDTSFIINLLIDNEIILYTKIWGVYRLSKKLIQNFKLMETYAMSDRI